VTGNYDGREVVVTGGTGGLGGAVVGVLLERGARVHVPVFAPRELERFTHADHERVRIHEGVDLRDAAGVERLYGEVPAVWASIHLVGGFAMGPLAESTVDDLRRMLELNVVTAFSCMKAAAEKMRAGGEGGRMVNVTAKPALVPTRNMAAYAASKAALANLTLSLAEELGPEGIFVNAIAPSIIDTPANRAAMPDADHEIWPKPAELAQTIAHLASPENTVVRGALVPVYGRT
jgi:NAD(P)-dependent dehydrogenase (short-subunit alcohol dehydrogenase family)